MPLPRVEVKIAPEGEATVTIDGVAIAGVGSVVIESVPGDTPRVTLEIVPVSLSVEAEGILTPHIIRAAAERSRTHNSR